MAPAPPPPASVSVGGIPAGYGRSCTNCSRAKCRCILRPEGGKCDRCHRLGKECQQMVTSRKRVAKRTTASRTAQLEEKLDDLVSILRATQQHQHQHQHHHEVHQSQPLPAPAPHQQPQQHHIHLQKQQQQQLQQQQQPPAPPLMNGASNCEIPSSASSASTCQPFISRLDSLADAATTSQSQTHPSNLTPPTRVLDRLPEPAPSEAEVYLVKFRQWLEFFPFMHLSPDLTAEALQRESPFLWLCIMNVTSMSMPQQAMMRDRLRQEIAQRMILNHERSIEILQGLITLISWAAMNAGAANKPFLTLYSHICSCIIYELNLSKFPNEEQYSTVCFKAWSSKSSANCQPKNRTMGERRLVLGFWFITSVCAAFLGKMEPLAWTLHMQESLEILESEKEYPSDETLVALVKLQLVGEEARKLIVSDFVGRDFGRLDPDKAPTYVFKRNLLGQLQKIRETLPPGAMSKAVIQLHIYSTETQIHSIGLFGGTKIPDSPRIDSMYAGLLAARAWYDTLFLVPLTDFVGMPFTLYIELAQIHALLYRLTTIDDSAWDKEIMRNTADLGTYLDRTIDLFTKADALYPLRGGPEDVSIFGKCTKVLRNVRSSWEPAISQNLGGLPTPSSQVVPGAAPQHTNTLLVDHSMMPDPELPPDFGDINWMTQVFGPWDI